MMDDFERRVQGEIGRLNGPGFPPGARAREQRDATIRQWAMALLAKEPLTGKNGALGPKRAAGVVTNTSTKRRTGISIRWFRK